MAGVDAVAVDYGGLDGGYQGVAGRVASALPGGGWTIVVHSGAGGLAPSIVEAADDPAGLIFVDAILPYPGGSWFGTVTPAMADRLRQLASDGQLPPWNMWFPSDPLDRMIASGSLRAAIAEELPLVPLAWLEAPAPALDGWLRLPSRYLQLSAAYAAETADARARGWLIERLSLHHLAMVTDADKVAQSLLSLAAA